MKQKDCSVVVSGLSSEIFTSEHFIAGVWLWLPEKFVMRSTLLYLILCLTPDYFTLSNAR